MRFGRTGHTRRGAYRQTESVAVREREAPHGGIDVVIHLKDAQETTDRDGAANPTRQVDELQIAATPAGESQACDQRADAGCVNMPDMAQI